MLVQQTVRTASPEDKTLAYVKRNTVVAQEGRKCVDGRYLPDQAKGMIARPGGDCGYVMALMAVNRKKKLGLTPEECFNAIYKIIASKFHGTFCIHTDHFIDPEDDHSKLAKHMHHTLIGCGHLMKAASQRIRKPYDVTSKEVRRLMMYTRNLVDISASVQLINLDGVHKEKAVLVIESDDYTVIAHDPKANEMFFIYDEKRDYEFMKKLVHEMNIPGVTFEDMKKESDIQLKATLKNLAKGFPIYRIAYHGKTPSISSGGKVH